MPRYEVNSGKLEVKLSWLERLASLRWGVTVPLSAVKGATVDRGAVPAFYKRLDRQFVYWGLGESVVVVELDGHKFRRLILGTTDPVGLEQLINRAIRN